jgi:hypothetical protein
MPIISVTLPSDDTTADVADYNVPITTIISALNGGLDADNLADNAVTTGKINDDAVTNAKVADDAVTINNVADSAQSVLRSTNFLTNGNMQVWQRNTSATPNDDVYSGADRWNFLAEANASWTVARDTDAPVGSQYSMKLSNVTANNQCAIVQFLENLDTKQLDDGVVSLSFYAKTTGTEIGNIRAAILTWGSTADSVTSDVIGTWAQNGTNPTWAANWTMENTPSNLALTSSWQRFTIENVAIDTATVNNLAVVIWVDDGTITSGDDLWISQVQLNLGSEAAAFQHQTHAEEMLRCMRYYEVLGRGIFGQCGSASTAKIMAQFRVVKRSTPTMSVINTTAAHEETWVASRTPAPLSFTSTSPSSQGVTMNIQGFSGMTFNNRFHTESDSIYAADAEL